MTGWPRYIFLGVLLVLGGCGSSDSGGGSSGNIGYVQVINGIEDSPALSLEVLDGDDVTERDGSLEFEDSTNLLSLSRGTYELDFFFADPEDGFDEDFVSTEVDVTRNRIFVAVLTGTFVDASVFWFDRPEGDATDTDSDEIELTGINLSSESVSVYVGDDAEGTSAANLVATLASGNNSEPLVRNYDDDADYHVRVVDEDSGEIVYDSGEISILESSRYTIVVTDPVGPSADTKSVFVVTDSGATAYPNTIAPASFVIVDAVADAASIDTEVSVSATGDALLAANLEFGEASTSVTADATFVDVDAVAATDPAVSYTTTVSLNEDTAYSFVVAGSSFSEDVSIRANERDLRRVANGVNVHFVNTLQETDDEDSSEVDFYALRLGDSLSDTAPVGTGIEYLDGFSEVIGATPYDLVVTTSGTQSILAGPARIFPDGGDRVVVIATEAANGGEPFQLSVVIDE